MLPSPLPPVSLCPRCSAQQVEVTINWRTSELRLRACHRCDLRLWEVDGRPAGLDSVLETLGSDRRARERGGLMVRRHWMASRP